MFPRIMGVRRGLGQFWDESAVRVEGKRWSYLGVSPEVAVCLVPWQHRQISSLAEALRDQASTWADPEGSLGVGSELAFFRRHSHL